MFHQILRVTWQTSRILFGLRLFIIFCVYWLAFCDTIPASERFNNLNSVIDSDQQQIFAGNNEMLDINI